MRPCIRSESQYQTIIDLTLNLLVVRASTSIAREDSRIGQGYQSYFLLDLSIVRYEADIKRFDAKSNKKRGHLLGYKRFKEYIAISLNLYLIVPEFKAIRKYKEVPKKV
jgi:hypothetical protein